MSIDYSDMAFPKPKCKKRKKVIKEHPADQRSCGAYLQKIWITACTPEFTEWRGIMFLVTHRKKLNFRRIMVLSLH